MNLIKGFSLLRFLLLAAILLFPLTSCTTLPERGVRPDYTVAVLPLYNATTDVDGPVLVRRVFNDKIQKYYNIKPLKDVDRLLRDQMGINLGAQLNMITPQKLGEVLGVDAVIYGYLLNFDDIKTMAYNVRKVRAGFKMVETKSGRTIWAQGRGVKGISGLYAFCLSEEIPKINGIDDIPGINKWRCFAPLGYQVGVTHGDKEMEINEAFDIMLLNDLTLINMLYFSFGVDLIGRLFNIHLISETKVMVNDIIIYLRTIDPEGYGIEPAPSEPEIPRLIFPAYSVFKDKDFSAVITMTTINTSTHESITRQIELAKFGDKLRSNRLSEGDNLTVIVKKEEKKGYLLNTTEKKYIEVNLAESDFKETDIAKEFIGEDKIDGQQCNKYKVRVTYVDGWIQDGFIWEAKNLNGLVVKVDLNDKNARIIMELMDVSFETPPSAVFKVPEGYTKIDY